MRVDAVASALARFSGPLFVALGAGLLVLSSPGGGVGFLAGLCIGAGVIVHALAFGVTATIGVFSPLALRVVLVVGVLLGAIAALADAEWAKRLQETAAFAATAASLAVVVLTVFGRAPTLRDDPW